MFTESGDKLSIVMNLIVLGLSFGIFLLTITFKNKQ